MRKLICFFFISIPILYGKDWIQLKNGGQEYLTHGLPYNNEIVMERESNTDSENKLSIGLKMGIGYNSYLKRVIKDSTQQLIIGLCLKQKITNLIDAEFTPTYQHLKSKDFGEGFTGVYYFDNLLIPIALKFNFLKKSFITLNWNIGAESVIELDGDCELWGGDSIFSKSKIKPLKKLFYLPLSLGGDVIVSSLIHLQIGTSLGYCVTPKITHVISNYPLRLCLGIMFLWK